MWSDMYSSGPKSIQDVLQCRSPTCTPVVQNDSKMYYGAVVRHVLQWSKMLPRCTAVQWSNMYSIGPKCFQDVLQCRGPTCTPVIQNASKMYYSAVVQDVLHSSGPRCTTVHWSKMHYSAVVQDLLQCIGPRCTTVHWSKMHYSAVVQDVLQCIGPRCASL